MRIAPVVAVLLVASPVLAFELKRDSTGAPVRWTDEVRFVVEASLPERLGEPSALAAVQRAVEAVSGAAGSLRIRAEVGEASGMGYDQAPGATNQSVIVVPETWDYDETVLAVTVVTVDVRRHVILDADIAFNAVHRTFRNLGDGAAASTAALGAYDDIQNTLTHELGHAVGLAHSPEVPEAVMYPGARKGEISKRHLSADDRQGLSFLYGDASSPGWEEPAVGCAAAPGAARSGAAVLGLALLVAALARRRTRPGRPAATHLSRRGAARGVRNALRVFALGSATFAAAQGAPASSASTSPPSKPPAFAAAKAASPRPLALAGATLVATGEVVSARTLPLDIGQAVLTTELEVRVRTCVKGECPATVRIRVAGGRQGDLEQIVAHQPVPRPGELLAVAEATHRKRARVWRLSEPRAVVHFAQALEAAGLRVEAGLTGSLPTSRSGATPSPSR